MAELIWSPEADAQFREIVEYIERDSPGNAAMVAVELKKAAILASEMPRAGSKVPEIKNESVRERLVCGYRLIYRIRPQSVTIVRVWRAVRPLLRRKL